MGYGITEWVCIVGNPPKDTIISWIPCFFSNFIIMIHVKL